MASYRNQHGHMTQQPSHNSYQHGHNSHQHGHMTHQPGHNSHQHGHTKHQHGHMRNQPNTGDPFHNYNDTWQVGLCNCCNNVKQCCYAYWCWPCFVYSLANKIDESCCSCCFVPGALMMYRMKVRSAFHIKGDACSDCLTVSCCPCCAGVQMRSEISSRGFH